MENEYFVSINEVSKRLNVPAHTLRYWEKQFPTAIRPTTGAGGRRYYRTETVARIQTIQNLLYNRGMTIAGVKKMIHNGELSDVIASENTGTVRAATPVVAPMPAGGVATKNVDADEIDRAIDLLVRARTILAG